VIKQNNQKAIILSVDMGYGHQRPAYSLRNLAIKKEIIRANNYKGIPKKDKEIWKSFNSFYSFISRFKKVPVIGGLFFYLFDQYQKIVEFYPRRNLSNSNFILRRTYNFFENGWGSDLIGRLEKKALPLICTFYVPAFMAEYFNYSGSIYCVVCDTDISRSWAPLDPTSSRIKYLAPTERVVKRLKLYGVRPENIILTGYPLPLENIGKKGLEILKEDLAKRLLILDPAKKYFNKYQSLIKEYLKKIPKKRAHPLTVMFAVGGAGAQKEIGIQIVKSLKEKIKSKKVKIILVAGIKKDVFDYFSENIKLLKLKKDLGKGIEIIFDKKIENYFKKFNLALRTTDILWTKPSELSFYSGLGLPIIIAPPIGSQERFNQKWLLRSGFAINQQNPSYANEWLFDLLEKGWLAEAAMEGFVETEKRGVLIIKQLISQD